MIVAILILVLLAVLLFWLCGYLPAPAQMPAQAIVAIIGILYVLQIFGVIPAVLPMFKTHL